MKLRQRQIRPIVFLLVESPELFEGQMECEVRTFVPKQVADAASGLRAIETNFVATRIAASERWGGIIDG